MANKNKSKFSGLQYKFLAIILLILAGGLVALPKYEKNEGIKPVQLLANVINPARYISTDEIAHKIISQDRSFILIDVRDEESYNKYTLPNAVHIPLKKILDEEFSMYVNQNQYDVIFFSNDNFYSDQAWVLCNRLGYKNQRVLKGGINMWFKTIINPPKPSENMPEEAFNLYSTRKASSMYFGVVYPEQVKAPEPVKKVAPKQIITVKKVKKAPEGGC